MAHTGLYEKNFEADIEQYLLTEGGLQVLLLFHFHD